MHLNNNNLIPKKYSLSFFLACEFTLDVVGSDYALGLKAYTGPSETGLVHPSPGPLPGKTGILKPTQELPYAHSLTFQLAYVLYAFLPSLEA